MYLPELQKHLGRKIRDFWKKQGLKGDDLHEKVYCCMLAVEKIVNDERDYPDNWPLGSIEWEKTLKQVKRHFKKEIKYCQSFIAIGQSALGEFTIEWQEPFWETLDS